MEHLSKEFIEHIKKAQDVSAEYNKAAKELLKSCKLVKVPAACLPDINEIMLISDDLLYQYENCMDHAKVHMKNCSDENCIRNCEKIIYSSQEAIKYLGNVEMECDNDLTSCVDAVETAIEKIKKATIELDKILN